MLNANETVAEAPAIPPAAPKLPREAAVELHEIVVTHELTTRPRRRISERAEIAGIHNLASASAAGTTHVVKQLATLALDLCAAGTAGVSMIETVHDGTEQFRWTALAGQLASYEGGTTPRKWSPCGVSLDAGQPVLYSYPARHFTYFNSIETPIVEGLVIPMYLDSLPIGTIWIVSHQKNCRFNSEDVRVMTSLGAFVAGLSRGAALDRNQSLADAEISVAAERAIVWGEYVRRIANGDHSALAVLYDETSSLVYNTALRQLRLREDAEEVAFDVYSRVWETAKTFESHRGSVAAWLVSMTRSRAVDRLRSRASRARCQEASFFESQPALETRRSAAAIEARSELIGALDVLPPEQRRVIELAYFLGLSASEIAASIGAPLGTVKARVRTGLLRLRRALNAPV